MIDLDGTVFDTYGKMKEKYFLEKGKHLDLTLIGDAKLMHPHDLQWLRDYFQFSDAYQVPVYPNAVTVLKHLITGNAVRFITTRNYRFEELTKRILKSYDLMNEIIFVKRDDKIATYKNIHPDLIVEDELNMVLPFLRQLKIILFERPWNKQFFWGYEMQRFRVVKSWYEVPTSINSLIKEEEV
ncbi:MAG: hypothetical protein GYA31_01400 [Parcubacteria group bacterium]|nr:hypothetical protein [Parcubacteria group bacterium]